MSDATKKNDRTVKQLAMDFDMTDIKSTREGENQSGFFTRKNKTSKKQLEKEAKEAAERPREARPGDAAIWGSGGALRYEICPRWKVQSSRWSATWQRNRDCFSYS
jgi:hypothetical protein